MWNKINFECKSSNHLKADPQLRNNVKALSDFYAYWTRFIKKEPWQKPWLDVIMMHKWIFWAAVVQANVIYDNKHNSLACDIVFRLQNIILVSFEAISQTTNGRDALVNANSF